MKKLASLLGKVFNLSFLANIDRLKILILGNFKNS